MAWKSSIRWKPLTDEDFLAEQDLIIPNWTMSQISNEECMGLLKAVRNGSGCAGWHGGMGDSFRNNTEYQFMVGGQFICHPGGVIDYEVEPISEDPIVSGLPHFKMHSEQYFMHVDPSNEVLAKTKFSGKHWGIDWVKDVEMPVWLEEEIRRRPSLLQCVRACCNGFRRTGSTRNHASRRTLGYTIK